MSSVQFGSVYPRFKLINLQTVDSIRNCPKAIAVFVSKWVVRESGERQSGGTGERSGLR